MSVLQSKKQAEAPPDPGHLVEDNFDNEQDQSHWDAFLFVVIFVWIVIAILLMNVVGKG